MIIKSVSLYKVNIPFTQPLKVAIGLSSGAKNVVVRLVTDTGLEGWGEGSDSPYITGGTQDSSFVVGQALGARIKGKDPLAIEERSAEINGFIAGAASIRCAFDMALYDLAAKAADMPLYQFLGGSLRALRTDLTIGQQERVEETTTRAQEILNAGFDAIKLKVGRPGLEDVAHVKAVRDLVGPDIQVKIDSNQGWDYPTAIANLKAMEPLNIQYAEQPLPRWDHEGLARLRQNALQPICADESVFDDKDALKLIKLQAADYLNIKLVKAGGIHTALKVNAIAEAAGKKCMIGCFGESRLGISAATHLASARPNITFLDLDSAYTLKTDPVIGGVTYDNEIGGRLCLPAAPGHGAVMDEAFLNACESVEV